MTYATSTDVADRLGRDLTEEETRIVTTRLSDAELLIRSRIPDLDDQVTAGTISVDVVKMIEAEAVLRLVRNPEGYTAETDGNYSYQLSVEVASGKLDILPDEWALLGFKSGAFVVTLFQQPAAAPCPPDPWWLQESWYL
jgi:hypothetical protein